nr:hypothetical protein [Tanacetum cinerariifolium]
APLRQRGQQLRGGGRIWPPRGGALGRHGRQRQPPRFAALHRPGPALLPGPVQGHLVLPRGRGPARGAQLPAGRVGAMNGQKGYSILTLPSWPMRLLLLTLLLSLLTLAQSKEESVLPAATLLRPAAVFDGETLHP